MCRRTGRPKVRVLQDSLEGIQETPNDARKNEKNQRESSEVIDFSLELTFKKMNGCKRKIKADRDDDASL